MFRFHRQKQHAIVNSQQIIIPQLHHICCCYHHPQNASHFSPTMASSKKISNLADANNLRQSNDANYCKGTGSLSPRVVSWKCSTCRYINSAVVEHCSFCGDPFKGDNSEEITVMNQLKKTDKNYIFGNNSQGKNNQKSSAATIDQIQSSLEEDTRRVNPCRHVSGASDVKNFRGDQKRGFRLHTQVEQFDWLCELCHVYNTTTDRLLVVTCSNCNGKGPKEPFPWRCGKCCKISNSLPAQDGKCSHCGNGFSTLVKCCNCHKPVSAFGTEDGKKCRFCQQNLSESAEKMIKWLQNEKAEAEAKKAILQQQPKESLGSQNDDDPIPKVAYFEGKPMRFAEKRIAEKQRRQQEQEQEQELKQRNLISLEKQKQQQDEIDIVQHHHQPQNHQVQEQEMPMLEDDISQDFVAVKANSNNNQSTISITRSNNHSNLENNNKSNLDSMLDVAEQRRNSAIFEQFGAGKIDSWVCQECGDCNQVSVASCPSCGAMKPRGRSSSSATISSNPEETDEIINHSTTNEEAEQISQAEKNSLDNDEFFDDDAPSKNGHEVKPRQTNSTANFERNKTSTSSKTSSSKGPNWRCVSCGNSVGFINQSCPICLQPKPSPPKTTTTTATSTSAATPPSENIVLQPQQHHLPPVIDLTPSASASTWNCPICRTENFSQRRACRICAVESGKGKQQALEVLKKLNFYPQQPSDIAGVRGPETVESSSASNQNVNHSYSDDEHSAYWRCSKCPEKRNPVDSPVCITCDAKRIIKDIPTLLAEQEEAERLESSSQRQDHSPPSTTPLPMITADGTPIRKTWLCTYCTKWNTSIKPHSGGIVGTIVRCRQCKNDPGDNKNSIWFCRSESCTRTHSDRLSLAMQAGVFEYLSTTSSGSRITKNQLINDDQNQNNNDNNNSNDGDDQTVNNEENRQSPSSSSSQQQQQQPDLQSLPKFHIVRSHSWNWGFATTCSHCGDFRNTETSPSIPYGWSCSECGSTSGVAGGGTSSNKKCRDCGALPAFAGDWKCSTCSAVNFSRRLACRRCAKTRTDEPSTAVLAARRWFRQATERGVKLDPLVFVDSENYPTLVAQEKEQALLNEKKMMENPSDETTTATTTGKNENNAGVNDCKTSLTQGSGDDNVVRSPVDDGDDDAATVVSQENEEFLDDAEDENELQELVSENQRLAAEAEVEAKAKELERRKEKNKNSGKNEEDDDEGEDDHSHLFVDGGAASRFYQEQVSIASVSSPTIEIPKSQTKETEVTKPSNNDNINNAKMWVCGLCEEPSNPFDSHECIKCGLPRDATEMKN